MPVRLQKAAGRRTEPPVSEPRAAAAIPAATAAAEPLLLPPGVRARLQGFRVGPRKLFAPVGPRANSCMFVFPMTTAPASMSRLTGSAVSAASFFSRIRLPAVVGKPSRSNKSLIARGTPPSGPRRSPRASASSHLCARSLASAKTRRVKALMVGSSRSILAMKPSSASLGFASPSRKRAASSATGRRVSSSRFKGALRKGGLFVVRE